VTASPRFRHPFDATVLADALAEAARHSHDDDGTISEGSGRLLEVLADRDHGIEDWLAREKVIVFTRPGTLAVEDSPPYPFDGGRLKAIPCRLTTAGSGTTTILVKVGATTYATLTFSSSATTPDSEQFDVDMPAGNLVLSITAVGSGAAGLAGKLLLT
jgi:hypothetical protein